MHRHGNVCGSRLVVGPRVAREAARSGRTDVLDWAEQHGLLGMKKVHQVRHIVYQICASGHLDVVQWYHRRELYFNIQPDAIRVASASDRVPMLEWLARTPELAFPFTKSNAMHAASEHGRRAVLEWTLRASCDPTLLPGRVVIDDTTYTHALP
ncbi:hypothetical protein BC828DRAFT_391731 [Blastocladiella britannica]|nr:hypothetical protein BC828DRAFT_391731 [Blastocladiella britannica]